MYYFLPPSTPKSVVYTISLNLGGLGCTHEAFIGPDPAHKTATAGVKSFTADGSSQPISVPITGPAPVGLYKIYVDIVYQGQVILEYTGLNGVLVGTGGVTDPGLS